MGKKHNLHNFYPPRQQWNASLRMVREGSADREKDGAIRREFLLGWPGLDKQAGGDKWLGTHLSLIGNKTVDNDNATPKLALHHDSNLRFLSNRATKVPRSRLKDTISPQTHSNIY